MMKHSPGTWTYNYSSKGADRSSLARGGDKSQVIDANGVTICEVGAVQQPRAPKGNERELSEVTTDMVEANARFIAAAPTMEAMLCHILVLIQQGADDQDLEAIEGHCRYGLGKAWGVAADEVRIPDLEEFTVEAEEP